MRNKKKRNRQMANSNLFLYFLYVTKVLDMILSEDMEFIEKCIQITNRYT